MVLLSLIGIGLGMYGAKKIIQEPMQLYREQQIKELRGDCDINTICDYMGIKKRNGIYQSYDFDNIERIMRRQFYFRDNDIDKIKKKFNNQVHKQQYQQKQYNDKKYKELYRQYMLGIRHGYTDDYYEVRHWHTLSKEEHQKRMNNIYYNTFWYDISIEPPYLMENDKKIGYIEVWHIKKPKHCWNIDKYYNIAVKQLGYK